MPDAGASDRSRNVSTLSITRNVFPASNNPCQSRLRASPDEGSSQTRAADRGAGGAPGRGCCPPTCGPGSWGRASQVVVGARAPQGRWPGTCRVASGDRPVKASAAAQRVRRRLSGTRARITAQSPGSLWTGSLHAASLPVTEPALPPRAPGAPAAAGRVMGRDGAGIKFSPDAVSALTVREPRLRDAVCHWARGGGCSSAGRCRRLSGVDR